MEWNCFESRKRKAIFCQECLKFTEEEGVEREKVISSNIFPIEKYHFGNENLGNLSLIPQIAKREKEIY